MSKSREQLINYLKEIDITDKVVLDAGCGPKEKWARNFTKGEPQIYTTVDKAGAFAPDYEADLDLDWYENNANPYAPEASPDTIENYLMMSMISDSPRKYDIVFCLETLEHLWNPLQAIKNLYAMAKDNGIIYISTPFINPYHDLVDYARYTSEWYEKVLTEVGFKNIKIKARLATVGLPYLTTFYGMEGLRMSKTRIKKGQQKRMAEIGYFVEATK